MFVLPLIFYVNDIKLANHISAHQLHKIVKSQDAFPCHLRVEKETYPTFPVPQEDCKLGVKIYDYNPGTLEAEAEESRVWGQAEPHSEILLHTNK